MRDMKNVLKGLAFCGCVVFSSALSAQQVTQQCRHVNFSDVKVNDNFWKPRLLRYTQTTLPVCIHQIETETGRIRNFENAAKTVSCPTFNPHTSKSTFTHSGIYFDDSDVYKAMEGMAYSLMVNPDPALEAKMDAWVDLIGRSQWPDGYINTYYTATDVRDRWKDMDRHEMYCLGHLIEAGVAYYLSTDKRKLLDICCKVADHLNAEFGEGKKDWVPGHQEIELALVKLAVVTNNQDYLNLAYKLLESRGHGLGKHIDAHWGNAPWDVVYHQDDMPAKDLSNAGGHAVRLMYQLCAMADVSALHPKADYMKALLSLWEDVVERNMYITGGIGSTSYNEGFTKDYDLPNESAYCETCASVGMVLWSQRMNELTGESKYIDVLERTLYNGLLAGINIKGDRFFYVNPLYSKGGHHRQPWYGCACCPSNLSRFLPSVGNYIYSTSYESLFINLYIGNEASVSFADSMESKVSMQTDYPWDGTTQIQIHDNNMKGKKLCLRIPDWCSEYKVLVNGRKFEKANTVNGYAVIDRKWKKGDVVTLSLDMPVRVTAANPNVRENEGKRAIERGPIVYCAEMADNPTDVDLLTLTPETPVTIGSRREALDNLQTLTVKTPTATFSLIPYYAWDNRAYGKMKIWFPFAK